MWVPTLVLKVAVKPCLAWAGTASGLALLATTLVRKWLSSHRSTWMGESVSLSTAHPVTVTASPVIEILSMPPLGRWRQGASWWAVDWSVATVCVQLGSISHGGTQVTRRHTIGPRQATDWLHWP